MKNCNDCKHCDPEWRSYSDLPICLHPQAKRRASDGNGIWAVYSIDKVMGGHCGKQMKHYEAATGADDQKWARDKAIASIAKAKGGAA